MLDWAGCVGAEYSAGTRLDLGHKDGTYSGHVEMDYFDTYVLDGLGDRDTLSIHVIVDNGTDIDVYLFSSEEYQKYYNKQYLTVPPLWGEVEIYEARTVYEKTAETLVLVIDNTDIDRDGARPEGPVSYTLTLDRVDYVSPWLIYMLIISIVLFLVAVMIYRNWYRHRRFSSISYQQDGPTTNRMIRRSYWKGTRPTDNGGRAVISTYEEERKI